MPLRLRVTVHKVNDVDGSVDFIVRFQSRDRIRMSRSDLSKMKDGYGILEEINDKISSPILNEIYGDLLDWSSELNSLAKEDSRKRAEELQKKIHLLLSDYLHGDMDELRKIVENAKS